MYQGSRITHNVKWLLLIATTLVTLGLVFIYSASSVFALEKFCSSHYFVKKQLIGVVLGIIGLIVIRALPLSLIKKITPYAFWGSLLLTAGTLVPGLSRHIHGSSRWLSLGGFAFQPSELLKATFIMYLAYLLTKKEHRINTFSAAYLPLLMVMGITALILLKQPDFGLTVTLVTTAFLLFFIAGIPTHHLLLSIAPLIPAVIGLILYKPYRVKRILTFLNPWDDPQGSGFQIIQSLIAIGSGSVWGLGIGHSKQKFFYLPMQHTDFIFSIIAEETGFMGATFIIVLFIAFLFVGMRIAWHMHDRYCMFTTLGFVILISLQAVINIFVTTGLLPTKGIGLPFVSYGNSALICSISMLGLIINGAHDARVNHSYGLKK